MKLNPCSFFIASLLASIAASNAQIVRTATADNLNLGAAWTGGTAPTGASVATWDASSTLTNTLGGNLTWGGLNVSAASGAVSISGNNSLTLDHTTDANTVFDTGANNFTWGVAGTAGAFNINGAAGSTSSTGTGATFAGSGTMTLSSTGTKNWSTNGTTNSVTNVTFTGTVALRGATIPTVGTLAGNWFALGGGGGAASAAGTATQTGSFALDTGDATSCGSFIVTQGWSGQALKLKSLQGTGSIRTDWGISAGTQTRGIELNQSTDTVLSGSILVHNGSSQRRNLNFVKKGAGTLTLTGGLGSSATAGGAVASLNFDIQEGAIQLGNGTTNPIYVNAANWDTASTLTIATGAKLRFMSSSDFTWSRAITGGSGTVEITNDGTAGEGNVIFTANNSGFAGNIDLNAGSLRMGPSLGSGTLTVKNGTFISVGLPATNGTSQVGALTLEDGTESDFRIGATNDLISVTNALTPPASGTHTINITGTPTGGGAIKLINYSGTALDSTQFASFALGIVPSGAATYELVNNTADTSVDLLITLEDQIWKAGTDGNWNSTTPNWVLETATGTPVAFNFENPSVFNDTAAIFAVTVDAAGVSPTKVTFNNSTNDYTFTGGSINGAGTLVKGGTAATTLAQSNTYSGGTTINGGTLRIGNGGTTGDIGSGAVTVAAGSTLEFNRSNTTPGTPDLDYKTNVKLRNVSGAGDVVITGGAMLFSYTGSGLGFAEAGSWAGLSGNLTVKGGSEFMTIRNGATAMGTGDVILGDATTSGTLSAIEGNWTWTNDIIATGSSNKILSRSINGPRTLKLQGIISGAGGLTLQDATGAMSDSNRGFILTGANTLSGTLTIAAATPVRVGGVPGNTDVTQSAADNSGFLGTASIVNDGTLTFSRKDAHSVGNAISGTGSVRVGIPAAASLGDTTTQVVTYTGTATYAGATTVNNGTLVIGAGASVGGSGVSVVAGSTLSGTGTVSAPVTAAGTIAPGPGTGVLTTGNTVLTGTYACDISGASSDKLAAGTLDITGATLTLNGTPTAASYTIATYTGTLAGTFTFTPPSGYALDYTTAGEIKLVQSGSEFDNWILGFYPGETNAAIIGIDADPDNDGIDNGLEFVLKGGNPAVSGGAQLPTGTRSGANYIFTFEREDRAKGANAGVTLSVEAGTSLAAWPSVFSVAADTASSTTGVVITNDGDANPDTVTVTIPTAGAPALFARLKAVETP